MRKPTLIIALALVASATFAQRKPIKYRPTTGGTTYVAISLPLFKHLKKTK